MICPTCEQPRRETCVACSNECARCRGEGEVFYRLDWLDPQTEESATCADCGGTGVNPDFVQYEQTYDELVQRHQRGETPPDNFDEEFDLLLARQERLDAYTPHSAAAPTHPSSHGRPVTPLRPVAQRDDLKDAA